LKTDFPSSGDYLLPDRTAFLIKCSFALLAAFPSTGHTADFSAEFFFGGAVSASSGLTIEQEGEDPIDFSADWDTKSFKQPLYWAARIAVAEVPVEGFGLELQLIHHKTYLENPPQEVQHFEISHGFNITTLNIGYYRLPVALRIGAGVVIAHTDAVVRGASTGGGAEQGYEVTGPALIAGAGRRIHVWKSLFASIDLQLSAARAKVSIPDGKASTANYALHLMAGLGYAF
jgi:hypothetical protein